MAKDKEIKIPILPPLVRKSLESGLICDYAVGENRRPETSVSEAINCDFQTIGPAKTRAGITQVGSSLGSQILGIHQFIDTVDNGANNQTMAVSGTVLYYLNSGTWTSLRTGLTAGQKARFCDFLNYTFMVNGADATEIWDGVVAHGFV